MSTETRYRRLLRLLPAWHRERYADEMTEVYLAGQPAEDARPGAGEVAATLRLGITARLRTTGRPSRATWWLVAVAATAALAGQAVVVSSLRLVSLQRRQTSWRLDETGRLVESTWDQSAGWWLAMLDLPGLAWLVVLVVVVAGWRRTAGGVAGVATLFVASRALAPLSDDRYAMLLDQAVARIDLRSMILPVVIVGALGTAGRAAGTAPRLRARLWTVGATLAALGSAWWAVSTVGGGTRADGTNWTVATAAALIAAVAVLVGARRLAPEWPATVLTLAAIVLAAAPLPRGPVSRPGGSVTEGVVVGVLAAVLAGIAWVVAADRRTPDHVPAERGGEQLVAG